MANAALSALALLLVGCAVGTFDPLPGQAEAERLVWNDMLGMDGAAPPVEWIAKSADGPLHGHDGLTIIGSRVQVVYWENRLISLTNFAHEMIHYSFWVRTGDVDPQHFRADWSIEETANYELRHMGM